MNTSVPVAVRDLRAHIDFIRTSCGHGKGSFIPRDSLHRYLSGSNLKNLLSGLEIPIRCLDSIENNFWLVFTILIQINQANSISDFIENYELKDYYLPFHRNDVAKWPKECHHFFDQFYARQWEYCVRKWGSSGEDKLTGFKLAEEALLPIVEETPLREGSNSRTFKINLHPEYNGLSPDTNEFVLKICSLAQAKYYKNELETYQILMQDDGARSNIVRLYGHFPYKNDKHLVLEYVNGGTLEALFHSNPPALDEIPAFWASFLSIFTPLYKLHDLQLGGDILQAIHQDFKPSNIMIARQNNSSYEGTSFKLIDFAFAQFRKRDPGEPALVFDEGGTQLFSAPELYRMDKFQQGTRILIGPTVDTWSFGAVLSETFVWCTLGKRGFEKFRSKRRKATEGTQLEVGGYGGCFHDGEKVLGVVKEMHNEALKAVEGNVNVHALLEIISTMVDSILSAEAPISRPNDHGLYQRCQHIINQARRLMGTQRSGQNIPNEGVNTSSGLRAPQTALRITPPYLPPDDDLPEGSETGRPREDSVSIFVAGSPQSESALSRENESYTPSLQPSISQGMVANGRSVNGTPMTSRLGSMNNQMNYRKSGEQSNLELHMWKVTAVNDWIDRKHNKFRNPLTGTSEIERIEGWGRLGQVMGRDQFFLFDDSFSMSGSWLGLGGVKQTFKALAYLVKRCTTHKMEAFLSCSKIWKGSKDRTDILALLDKANLAEECNMSYWIKHALDKWKAKSRAFEKPANRGGTWLRPKNTKEPGLDLYIFTAGIWQEVPGSSHLCGVDEVIRSLLVDMRQNNVLARQIRIRFIRFDNILVGVERLEKLMEKLHSAEIPEDMRKVVDVVPHDGDIWKMLVG